MEAHSAVGSLLLDVGYVSLWSPWLWVQPLGSELTSTIYLLVSSLHCGFAGTGVACFRLADVGLKAIGSQCCCYNREPTCVWGALCPCCREIICRVSLDLAWKPSLAIQMWKETSLFWAGWFNCVCNLWYCRAPGHRWVHIQTAVCLRQLLASDFSCMGPFGWGSWHVAANCLRWPFAKARLFLHW